MEQKCTVASIAEIPQNCTNEQYWSTFHTIVNGATSPEQSQQTLHEYTYGIK